MGIDKFRRGVVAPSFTPEPNGIALSKLAHGTNGQLVIGQTGAATAYKTVTGDVTIDQNGATAIGAGKVTEPMLAAPAATGLGVLRLAHARYDFSVDGGAQGAITPTLTAAIPNKAILIGATVNPSTAITSLGSATVAIGTTAGSAANSILTATGKASLTINALVNGTVTLAAPVKMSAGGSINVTIGTADLTAGVIEIFVYYVVSAT